MLTVSVFTSPGHRLSTWVLSRFGTVNQIGWGIVTRNMSNPRVRKIPWRRKWQPTPVLLPGKSHGQRSLVGYHLWDCKRVRHGLVTKQQHGGVTWTCQEEAKSKMKDRTGSDARLVLSAQSWGEQQSWWWGFPCLMGLIGGIRIQGVNLKKQWWRKLRGPWSTRTEEVWTASFWWWGATGLGHNAGRLWAWSPHGLVSTKILHAWKRWLKFFKEREES